MHSGYARSVNPPPTGIPAYLLGTAVIGGGALIGIAAGRAIYRATMCPPGTANAICGPQTLGPGRAQLSGMSGSVMVGGQDASWSVEPMAGADPSSQRYAWSVHALPAGTFITSSPSDFPSVEQTLADLAGYGQAQGWVFEA